MPRTANSAVASIVVGQSIRRVRQKLGLTQGELAERLGTTAPYVSALENGKANPTVGQLSAVASAMRVELHVEFYVPEPRAKPTIPPPAIQ